MQNRPPAQITWLAMLLLALLVRTVVADEVTETSTEKISPLCPDAGMFGPGLVTKVCWKCMLPIRPLGIKIGGGPSGRPDGAYDKPFCSCAKGLAAILKPGVSFGGWLPTKVVEVVKTPFCSPLLGGRIIGRSTEEIDGDGGPITILDMGGSRSPGGSDTSNLTRYQVHAFAFPVLTMMGFLTEVNCLPGAMATLDMIGAPSEFLPTWNDEELGILVAGESILFSNPIAQMSCGIDCVSSTSGSPIDSMFYCAGCWGHMYPMSGNISDPVNPVKESALLMARYTQYNHRMGMWRKTYGKDAMCGNPPYAYTIEKSAYRFSMLFPVASADGSKGCCHPFGKHHFLWSSGRTVPGTGEDYVYLLWQWVDCCVSVM